MKKVLQILSCFAFLAMPVTMASSAWSQEGDPGPGPHGNPQLRAQFEQLHAKMKADHEKVESDRKNLEADRKVLEADQDQLKALKKQAHAMREERHEALQPSNVTGSPVPMPAPATP